MHLSPLPVGRSARSLELVRGLLLRSGATHLMSPPPPSVSPPPKRPLAPQPQQQRKILAAVADQERKKEQRRQKKKVTVARAVPATAMPNGNVSARGGGGWEEDSDGGRSTQNSLGSAIAAPDWPPVKENGQSKSNEKSVDRKAAAPTVGRLLPPKVSSRNVKATGRQAAVKVAATGLEAWSDIGDGGLEEKRTYDRLMNRSEGKRRVLDEYDVEYDRGRIKKVKIRDDDGGGGRALTSATFDKAFKSKQNGKMMDVQLRGKKKRNSERGGRGGGRGRGDRGGGRGGRRGGRR